MDTDRGEEFVLSGPLWVVGHRESPLGYLRDQHQGTDYLVVFTESELAYRYYEGRGKPAWMLLGQVETPRKWIRLLKQLMKGGCQYVGVDPTPDGKPFRVFPTTDVLASAIRAFGDASP